MENIIKNRNKNDISQQTLATVHTHTHTHTQGNLIEKSSKSYSKSDGKNRLLFSMQKSVLNKGLFCVY